MAKWKFTSFRPSLLASLVMIVLLVGLGLLGLEVQQSRNARADRLLEAERDTANIARSLAQHARSAIELADSVLLGLRERFEQDGTGPEAIKRMENLMRLRAAASPVIHSLFLFDEDGGWLANSIPDTARYVNYADNAYFRFHRNETRDLIYVGLPIRSKADNTSVITVSRRLYHPDGQFAGVVTATIATAHFQSFYETFDLGHGGTITLINDAGDVLVRGPFADGTTVRNVKDSALSKRSLTGPLAASMEFTSVLDRTVRIGSYYRLPEFTLRVTVSLEKAEILASWWHQTGIDLLWLLAVVAALVLLGRRVATQISDRTKAQDLYRLLADHSGDAIVCIDAEGRRRYSSPSFWTMTGWSEREMTFPSADIVHPDDIDVLEQAVEALRQGAKTATARYRYMRPDCTLLWVEMRASVASAVAGQPMEIVANIRDISLQKAAEEELAEANIELAAMTLTDPLTGISNRRHFEQALRREWARAMRNGSQVALMMIDADHFKAFNDLYGHVAGDSCLKLIAMSLAGAIRRPGDVAARYGGEEFAVILPETQAHMAARIAERMMEVLTSTAIPHAGNAAGIVTVSIGLAAIIPSFGSDSKHLVEAADEALYRAKADGRNQLCVLESRPARPQVMAAE